MQGGIPMELWMWAIGLLITASLGWATMLIAAFSRLNGALERLKRDVDRKKADSDRQLTDIRQDFVRRVDLDNHILRLGEDVRDLRTDMQTSNDAINRRLDALLAAVVKSSATPQD